MTLRISFTRRILDFLLPRQCCACGERLAVSDHAICMKCNLHLPRTKQCLQPKDNEMAQLFWHLIPIENAAALFFYQQHSPSSNIILQFKYRGKWNIAEDMGRMAAKEFTQHDFFDGIDVILPVPITKKRKRERGYNQSHHIAVGISEITGLPIVENAVKRIKFSTSQTQKHAMERRENVAGAFKLSNGKDIEGKHVLVVDDVVTTGSTVLSCCLELVKGGVKSISILSLGYTKG